MVKIDSFLARELPGHFRGPLEASLGGRRGDLKRTFPRQAERKSPLLVHERAFSSTGRGKSPSQAHAKSMRRPFRRQAGGNLGKSNRERFRGALKRIFPRQAGVKVHRAGLKQPFR